MSCGIPYMGSKKRIAKKLVDFILSENPNCNYVYDLFGGGGAMSFEFLARGKQVYYNDLNTGVVELLKKIQKDGVTEEFYNWVSRDEFHAHKDDDTWYGGLLKTCWSFGNNQRGYLYGKHIEALKKEAHDFLFSHGYDRTAKSRIELLKQFRLQQFERLQQFKRLQQLQQLEHLGRLEQLEQLQLSNLPYEQVPILTPIEDTIIYIDPPYKGTAKYQCMVDHNALNTYILNSPYKIYVSSYEYPELKEALSIPQRCTLSQGKNTQVFEKLFTNS